MKRIPKKSKGGDCYEVAGKFALEFPNNHQQIDFFGTPYVVHAEVEGQGSIQGLRYGHAWIEDDLLVYDFSNGRDLVLPKDMYYRVGKVKKTKPKYFRYTFSEAKSKMIENGHYGSWDLKTESGL